MNVRVGVLGTRREEVYLYQSSHGDDWVSKRGELSPSFDVPRT